MFLNESRTDKIKRIISKQKNIGDTNLIPAKSQSDRNNIRVTLDRILKDHLMTDRKYSISQSTPNYAKITRIK